MERAKKDNEKELDYAVKLYNDYIRKCKQSKPSTNSQMFDNFTQQIKKLSEVNKRILIKNVCAKDFDGIPVLKIHVFIQDSDYSYLYDENNYDAYMWWLLMIIYQQVVIAFLIIMMQFLVL